MTHPDDTDPTTTEPTAAQRWWHERSHRAGGLAYGYPVHRVLDDQVTSEHHPHGVLLTRWTAVCGVSGVEAGGRYGLDGQPRGSALRALRGELCPDCWPMTRRHRHAPDS